ncbi:MAG TPA: hypothetical protein VJY62_17815 [Bacteroidia bacterium]|nr:hypothetical protein [Bacteroidia bacterium]
MQSIEIFSQQSEVNKLLFAYLLSRNYKNVNVNISKNEITAEGKRFLFWKNKFQFKIITEKPHVTNIEVIVNPQNLIPLQYDLKKEIKLAERIYSFF